MKGPPVDRYWMRGGASQCAAKVRFDERRTRPVSPHPQPFICQQRVKCSHQRQQEGIRCFGGSGGRKCREFFAKGIISPARGAGSRSKLVQVQIPGRNEPHWAFRCYFLRLFQCWSQRAAQVPTRLIWPAHSVLRGANRKRGLPAPPHPMRARQTICASGEEDRALRGQPRRCESSRRAMSSAD
mgnify:CR=1 FL=1